MAIKEIHIGELITKRMLEMHLKPTDLAKRLGYSLPGTTRILGSRSMNTDVLQKICKALEFDFFRYYVNGEEPVKKEETAKVNNEEKVNNTELDECKKENDSLRKETEYLKKIVGLYENERKAN